MTNDPTVQPSVEPTEQPVHAPTQEPTLHTHKPTPSPTGIATSHPSYAVATMYPSPEFEHPYFDKHGGRMIFFEGTYTTLFSGNKQKTPRYDYNQVMYKLDLAHPDLQLPAPGKPAGNQ